MRTLGKPLWRQRNVSLPTKIRVYKSCVLAVLLYGAETWPLTKAQVQRLSGFDTRAQRVICGILRPTVISNDALRFRTGLPPLARTLAAHRLRWYGHLLRTSPSHPTRLVLEFDLPTAGWRRPRGAPLTRYLDVIREDLRFVGIPPGEAIRRSSDRNDWSSIVASVVSTPAWREN